MTVFGVIAEAQNAGMWPWVREHGSESLKELLIGGPWFLIAYLIHSVHHRVFHRPANWIMRRVFRTRGGGGH